MDDFDDWIEVKKGVHSEGKRPTISEGEVWWCAVGKNVGIEINGKSERFSRPVLIFKKLSKLGFLGVPLTSQNKIGLVRKFRVSREKRDCRPMPN